MTEHSFALIPFPDRSLPIIEIIGQITREQNVLTVQYSLTGGVENILLPGPVSHPGRRRDLWLATCFEFFLTIIDHPQYWEFNLSPSSEWNAFRMDAYRGVGFREEELISDIQLDISQNPGWFRLDAEVDLSAVIDPELDLLAGIAGVIQTLDGHKTYWALTHPNDEADFHLRESFILALAGKGHP